MFSLRSNDGKSGIQHSNSKPPTVQYKLLPTTQSTTNYQLLYLKPIQKIPNAHSLFARHLQIQN